MGVATGPLKRACGWRLALLFGTVLALCPQVLHAAPEDPAPTGFVWEDLKEIRGRLLRPEKSFFRRLVHNTGINYYVATQPFEGEGSLRKGLTVEVMTKVTGRTNLPADEFAAASVASLGTSSKVLKGWTRKGEPPGPFTTYALVCEKARLEESGMFTIKVVYVANRDTDTLYTFILASPRAEWKDVEEWGDTVLANLRLDPRF